MFDYVSGFMSVVCSWHGNLFEYSKLFKSLNSIVFCSGDVMVKYKIEFNEDSCIGCGACASACPDNWEMDVVAGKAKLKVSEIDESQLNCNKEAEDVCPADAIKIEEIK